MQLNYIIFLYVPFFTFSIPDLKWEKQSPSNLPLGDTTVYIMEFKWIILTAGEGLKA